MRGENQSFLAVFFIPKSKNSVISFVVECSEFPNVVLQFFKLALYHFCIFVLVDVEDYFVPLLFSIQINQKLSGFF